MLPKINPTTTSAWRALTQHFAEIKKTKIKDLFAADPSRFSRHSVQDGDILFDYSKNIITNQTLELLQDLAARRKPLFAIYDDHDFLGNNRCGGRS